VSDELDPNKNVKLRRFAELEVERQSASADRLLNQHVADFKWLTASLLLLNSGASVAILNTPSVSNNGKMVSGSLYLAGIVFALLVGVASQKFAMKSLPGVIGYRALWLSISQGDTLDLDAERQAIGTIQAAAKRAWIVPALGYASAALFLAGSLTGGLHLVETATVSSHQQGAPSAR